MWPRARLLILVFTCAVSVCVTTIRAQPARTFEATVKQSLIALISKIAVNVKESTPGQSISAEEILSLQALGAAKGVSLSDSITAGGLSNFNAHVRHAKGTSEWTIGALVTGEIVAYELKGLAIDAVPPPSEKSKAHTRGEPDQSTEVAVPAPTITPESLSFCSPLRGRRPVASRSMVNVVL